MESLEINLLGKAYRVSCTAEERAGLLDAVALLDRRLKEVAAKTQSSGERLAIMTALNLAHDLLTQQRGNGFDSDAARRRISLVNARLDGVLGQQENLF